MRALITNDDGIQSRGIKALTEIVSDYFDEIWIVSTEHGNSGKSHAITMEQPIFIDKVHEDEKFHIYKTTGTPVDCVKIAIDYLLENKGLPDMVFSGINHGANSNSSVFYSGTLGAATEGAFHNIPSIGFSLTDHDPDADLTSVIYYTRLIIQQVLSMSDKEKNGLCLNVNVPSLPLNDIKGIRYARQAKGCWREDFIRGENQYGRKYVWMKGAFRNYDSHPKDTDDFLLNNGYVTIVPVITDMTDYDKLKILSL